MARFIPRIDVGAVDVKLGLRLMRKSWGLTLVGGVAMAVTIGLGTSIFTIWNAVTSTSLPLPDGDRIVAIQGVDRAKQRILRDSSLDDLRRWREQLRSVSEVSAMRRVQRTLVTPAGGARPVSVGEMTASAFGLARVAPMLGRAWLEEDERAGAANVAVIGFRVWRDGFSSDPDIIGRKLRLDDADYTIVGVMPAGFAFPVNQRVWIPLRTNPLDYPGEQQPSVFVFARLAPGFTQHSAQAEVSALGMLPPKGAPQAPPSLRARVVPYATGVLSLDASRSWTGTLIVALAALLLLPPCVNIGILVYARAVTRREEFATRYALGASRGRIVTQIFVEVLVLAASAGLIGLIFARNFGFAERISQAVLPGMGPANMPFWITFTPSLSTVLCLVGLVVLAAAIAGAGPGLRVTSRWRQSGLHALGERGTKVGLGRTWTALLALQVAVAVAVLPVGSQVIWGIVKPSVTGPSMDVDRYLTGWLVMEADAPRFAVRQAELLRRLSGEPAITGVTLSADPLMDESDGRVEVDGGPKRVNGRVAVNRVDPAFFDLFGAHFRMGRTFNATEFGPGESRAVVVTRTFAMEIAGTENVLGRRVRYLAEKDAKAPADPERWYEIVGVVEDFPPDYAQATVFHPLVPGSVRQVAITVRAGSDPKLAATRLREIAGAIDPELRLARLQSLGDLYRQQGSVGSTLGLLFAGVMLIVVTLAMAGMYTLMAFIVAQRWREVGVRCALGASPRRLVTEIFGRSLVPLAIGAGVGCLVAIAIDAGIHVEDVGGLSIPGVIPATALVMILVGALALAGPALRAIRIKPADALRAI